MSSADILLLIISTSKNRIKPNIKSWWIKYKIMLAIWVFGGRKAENRDYMIFLNRGKIIVGNLIVGKNYGLRKL